MASYLESGSGIERALHCSASVALPHSHHESQYTNRGTAIHEYLEAVSKVGREAALEQVPDEWREACAELNLEGLEGQLSLAAEVALAYDYETDTARELGRGVGRAYDDVGITEIPTTLDVVGIQELSQIRRRGLYTEWKSGWTTRRKISQVTQIHFGALAVSRAFDCDTVEGQLVHVHEDVSPWVQRIELSGWELDAFGSQIREHAVEWRAVRERWLAGVMPRDYNTGPWCERCPAREFCPAQTSLLRSVLERSLFDGMLRMDPIPDDALAAAWHDIHAAQSVLSLVKSKILGVAATRKIFLGLTDDGSERWLGPVISDGNEKLDGESVFDVVAALPAETWIPGVDSEAVAALATKVTATKKDVDAAIKAAVPRGKKAGVLRDIYEQLAKVPGAITTKPVIGPKEIVVKALRAGSANRQLPAPSDAIPDEE